MDFLTTLDVAPAHIVGHSRGGYLAARVAIERPELVRTIVIVDSATLMQPITFYQDVADAAPHFDDPKELSKYLTTQNSFGTEHITDEWTEGKIRMDALDSVQRSTAKKLRAPGPVRLQLGRHAAGHPRANPRRRVELPHAGRVGPGKTPRRCGTPSASTA